VVTQASVGRHEALPTASGKAVPTRSPKSLLRRIGDNRTLLIMCLPALAFFIVFSYAPLPGAWIAFTNFNYRDGIFGSPFVGFRNFEFLIKSGQLWLLTKNTILYNVAFIVLGNILQIALAIMLN
jgi:putative aldouronate transport system permease protein